MNRLVIMVCLCGMLSACGGSVSDTLGFGRNSPDEFQVVSQPPLSVPPIYHLRPPADAPVGQVSADARAKSLVLGAEEPSRALGLSLEEQSTADTAVAAVGSDGLPTSAEQSLLQKAGAPKAQEGIRSLLIKDNTPLSPVQKKASWYERFRFSKDEEAQSVVDAEAERLRLLENKKAGKPVTEGETPQAKENTSVLDRIF